jgi:hypothetical protein
MPLNDPVPSSAFDVAKRNASDFDSLLQQDSGTVETRTGKQLLPWQAAMQRYAAYNNTGAWVTGTAYQVNDLWESSGTWYVVLTAYTSGATPGDDIASGNVQVWQVRDFVSGVDTIADLRALEPLFDGQQVSLSGYNATAAPEQPKGGGIFTAKYGDYSAEVSADTLTGIYVAFPSDPSGTTGAWVRGFNGSAFVEWFGAKGDNISNDQPAIQAAIDFFGTSTIFTESGGTVRLGKGFFRTNSPLVFKSSWVKLIGDDESNTTINFFGSPGEAAITTDTVNDVYSYNGVSNIALRVNNQDTVGIRFDRCQGANFSSLLVQLLADYTVAFYGAGNGVGSAPYYNSFDDLFLAGAWSPGNPTSDCVAFRFVLNNPTRLDAPNSNVISNIKRAAAFNTVFDIQAGNSNMFTNIGAESIGDYFFNLSDIPASFSGTATSGTASSLTDNTASFPVLSNGTLRIISGSGAGTVGLIQSNTSTTITLTQSQHVEFDNTSVYEVYNGKCSGNKVINLRHEGTNTTALVRNSFGANNNIVSNVFSTGAVTRWVNLAKDPDFIVNPIGSGLTAITFYAENIAANSTTTLSPRGGEGLSIAGGVRIARSGNITALSTAVNNMSSSAAGSAVVKLIQNGSEATSVRHTITNNNRFGYTAIADVIDDQVIRDRNLHVIIETDSDWDATASDFSVTVWISH